MTEGFIPIEVYTVSRNDRVSIIVDGEQQSIFQPPKSHEIDQCAPKEIFFDLEKLSSRNITFESDNLTMISIEARHPKNMDRSKTLNYSLNTTSLTLIPHVPNIVKIDYACVDSVSWGAIDLLINATSLNITNSYNIRYIAYCRDSVVAYFDLSYLILMGISLVIIYLTGDLRASVNFRNMRGSPLLFILYFGAMAMFLPLYMVFGGFKLGILKILFCIIAYSATALMLLAYTELNYPELLDRRARISQYITKKDLIAGTIAGGVLGVWLVAQDWLTNNLLAISIIVIALWVSRLKTMRYTLLLLGGVLAFDSLIYLFASESETQSISTFSRYDNLPVKISMPKVFPNSISYCASLGIGDIIIPGLYYKLLREYETLNGIRRSLSIGGISGYFIGCTLCVSTMLLMNSVKPLMVFVIPFMIISSFIVAWYTKHFRGLMKHNDISLDRRREQDQLID